MPFVMQYAAFRNAKGGILKYVWYRVTSCHHLFHYIISVLQRLLQITGVKGKHMVQYAEGHRP